MITLAQAGQRLRFEGLHKQRWGFFLDGTYIGLREDTRGRRRRNRPTNRGMDSESSCFLQMWIHGVTKALAR